MTPSGPRLKLSEAIISLKSVSGDIIAAVLFIPVALAFQNLVGSRLFPSQSVCHVSTAIDWSDFFDALTLITILLLMWILETMALTLAIINWGMTSFLRLTSMLFLTLIYCLGVTLMGYVTNTVGFQCVFMVSMFAALFGLVKFEWDDTNITLAIDLFLIVIAITLPAFIILKI